MADGGGGGGPVQSSSGGCLSFAFVVVSRMSQRFYLELFSPYLTTSRYGLVSFPNAQSPVGLVRRRRQTEENFARVLNPSRSLDKFKS